MVYENKFSVALIFHLAREGKSKDDTTMKKLKKFMASYEILIGQYVEALKACVTKMKEIKAGKAEENNPCAVTKKGLIAMFNTLKDKDKCEWLTNHINSYSKGGYYVSNEKNVIRPQNKPGKYYLTDIKPYMEIVEKISKMSPLKMKKHLDSIWERYSSPMYAFETPLEILVREYEFAERILFDKGEKIKDNRVRYLWGYNMKKMIYFCNQLTEDLDKYKKGTMEWDKKIDVNTMDTNVGNFQRGEPHIYKGDWFNKQDKDWRLQTIETDNFAGEKTRLLANYKYGDKDIREAYEGDINPETGERDKIFQKGETMAKSFKNYIHVLLDRQIKKEASATRTSRQIKQLKF